MVDTDINPRQEILKELEIIKALGGGLVDPHSVVNFARDPTTTLHNYFDWNDTTAAEKYRVWQARQLLRVLVIVEPSTQKHINAFVSLRSDRKEGGYRSMVDILNSVEKRGEMLKCALEEARLWRRKYDELKELDSIFKAIDSIKEDKQNAGIMPI